LDPAPKWCPFLDNLTEELEEQETQTVYDEFKFLSHNELEELNALHLLETKMVKQYLHGYLIHLKLFHKLTSQKGY
jgi:ribosome biogenesis protein ENP2